MRQECRKGHTEDKVQYVDSVEEDIGIPKSLHKRK